jgi:prepilin-type N-terminal cleavage/methylation domain-containing protein
MNVRKPLPNAQRPRVHARGFTLVELMITLVVLALVVAALAAVMTNASRSKERTSQNLEATQTARATLDMVSKDIRSAGYDDDLDNSQTAIAYVDSTQIIISENQSPYPDTTTSGGVRTPQGPQAYNPTGSPKPFPLSGTSWTPPQKYNTGAELVRYTLDLNDDGVIDAGDLATAAGADARATPNPNDYVMVREVYGDNTGGVAGNNGGVQERVALVRKPGNGVPPIYTVYMRGSTTPYDWSNGPVPQNQLQNIDRVTVQVTASSAKPDNKGNYPVTTLRTQVNSFHNSPLLSGSFGGGSGVEYVVSGYVYNDKNTNRVMDGTDVGIAGATVQLGPSFIRYTNASGFFSFSVPPGTYTLKHTPAAGYGSYASPDSYIVNVTTANIGGRSFPDTARQGGWVTVHVFNDVNGNHVEDAGDTPLQNISVAMAGASNLTDASGNVQLFSAPGSWSALATVPDTMTTTTSNPVTGTITNGGTASASIGMIVSANGDVTGNVYKDTNRNGTKDAGETGIQNVWVGISKDNGVTVLGWAMTNNNGDYDISVPYNDPPKTTPYTLYIVPPAGYFPTGPTASAGLYVKAAHTYSGYNFGMANYTVITLTASRVLSLASADLIEKDWSGNATAKARGDVDLVLGADAGGTDQISVWYNNADTNVNPFGTGANGLAPDKKLSAPNSVLCMALDTLDAAVAPFNRPDLVTGTKYTNTGNFFVWYTQNSSGNEGKFPESASTPGVGVPSKSYLTGDNGDVQAVVTMDCIGGNKPDIIVGTKSPTANQGRVELWTSDNAATPSYTRAESLTTWGGGAYIIGEVTAMLLVDLNNDGLKDLVVATKTGTYTGQVLYFQNMGKAASPHFVYRQAVTTSGLAPTSLAASDLEGDGYQDIMVGTQNGTSTGSLIWLKNNGLWGFATIKVVAAPGIVTSLGTAPMGGGYSTNDLIVGYRGSTSDYSGGVRIYYLGVGGIPDTGVDPSGGTLVNMVPALTTANFNYWTYGGGAPTPYLQDLAAGVKIDASNGKLYVFIR